MSQTFSSPTAEEIEDRLVREVAERVGIDPGEIDVDVPLTRYGLDSLHALEILTDLELWLDRQLSDAMLAERPSIAQVVVELTGERPTTERPRSERPSVYAGPQGVLGLEHRLVDLNSRVDEAKQAGMYYYHPVIEDVDGAWATVNGRRMLVATSYSYLGMMRDERVAAAAVDALQAYGAGSHGSRFLAGTTSLHEELERELAAFMGAEDAIVFTSGFVTNVSTISALFGKGDVLITDHLNHASIAAGCRHSGARTLVYAHNDMDDLEECLRSAMGATTLVVADAVFSMSGTILPLPEVVELCQEYGAHIMLDEAHSFGVLGATGRGIAEHFGVDTSLLDIRMGTLSKAIPSSGGFVCGSRELVSALRHHAGGYIFSGANPPPLAAAALAGLRILEDEPHRILDLTARSAGVRDGLRSAGLDVLGEGTPIVPVLCRDLEQADGITRACHERGVFVLPVVYPAVPLNAPRLRLSVTADYTPADVDHLVDVVVAAAREHGLLPGGASR